MSKKDMLGPLVRALVGVPLLHQGILYDLINKLSCPDDQFVLDFKRFLRNWKKRSELLRITIPVDFANGSEFEIVFRQNGWEVVDEAREILLNSYSLPRGYGDLELVFVQGDRIGARTTFETALQFAKENGYILPPRIVAAIFYKHYMETSELRHLGIKSWIVMSELYMVGGFNHLKRMGVLHHLGEKPTLYAYQDRDDDRSRWVDGDDVLIFLAPKDGSHRSA